MGDMKTGSLGKSADEVKTIKPKKDDDASEPNSVDVLNRQYREDADKAAKNAEPEPNAIDELNREAQGGAPTAAAQTEALDASINPEGGLEEPDAD